MATLAKTKDGHRITWGPRSSQQSIFLGRKYTARDAKAVRSQVELLVSAVHSGNKPPVAVLQWLGQIDASLHRKLVDRGLTEPRQRRQLGDYLDCWFSKRPKTDPGTLRIRNQANRNLLQYFVTARAIDRITVGDAADWWLWRIHEKCLSEITTARKTAQLAHQFFCDAVSHRTMPESPSRTLLRWCGRRK